MFVLLSKLLDLAVSPLAWALLLGVLAVALGGRRPRTARGLGAAGIAVLWLFSTPMVSQRLMASLEADAPRTWHPDVEYDAVILLGGAVEPIATARTGRPELNHGSERILRTWELLRTGRARMVLVSGGLIFPQPGLAPEADTLAGMLREWGVAPERIVTETRSRNTRENAVLSAPLVRERGWRRVVLVTSAFHMERAVGCFRAAGVEPDTLPVDLRAPSTDPGLAVLPRTGALAQSGDALREWLGRVVYRVMGYTA